MAYRRDETNETRKFCDLLGKFDTGMLITHAGNNNLHGRPMAVAQLEEFPQGCDLWFVTSYDTPKMDEIRSNSQVLVTFQNRNDQFLSLSGRAELVRDRQKVDELWQEPFKVWFPEGKDDPNLVLIQVHASQGEYWDNGGLNKISFLFEAMKAYTTGDTPNVKEGAQHGKVQL